MGRKRFIFPAVRFYRGLNRCAEKRAGRETQGILEWIFGLILSVRWRVCWDLLKAVYQRIDLEVIVVLGVYVVAIFGVLALWVCFVYAAVQVIHGTEEVVVVLVHRTYTRIICTNLIS